MSPISKRNSNLKYRYGITEKDFDDMYSAQKGRCAICNEKKPLVVDHDHDTGEVRGLLCNTCNSGMGKLMDNMLLLARALKYLLVPPRKVHSLS